MRRDSHGHVQRCNDVTKLKQVENKTFKHVFGKCMFSRCMIHAWERKFIYCCWQIYDSQCDWRLRALHYFIREIERIPTLPQSTSRRRIFTNVLKNFRHKATRSNFFVEGIPKQHFLRIFLSFLLVNNSYLFCFFLILFFIKNVLFKTFLMNSFDIYIYPHVNRVANINNSVARMHHDLPNKEITSPFNIL